MKRELTKKLDKIRVKHMFNLECYYCGEKRSEKELTVDHVIPLSKGGCNALFNKRPACVRCNSLKSNSNLEDFLSSGLIKKSTKKELKLKMKEINNE